ncbi:MULTISPECIES: hypothetical protein [Curtobacterium]|uniref:Uncharacterized protein n=1 Tax=Curtobacterium aurantiacum TaxID=3236919 RepID=A0ABS5VIY4_9MICO|nr:hypothetical protein [Curtobacterium flaccumfaciens]MBO9045033.1 hypothetical protein [Curtobacterium flaccumfaciens pv. flaccumfaciens]MBO9048825.1 hypothetical protein [Curtobacterium flaccumfaciens pv. flaccumfaciens]MBT1545788.1 hypothetical protein [Curtobacterium flaccumfaciens pv. flaccumfaciens]MBT1588984.1 hypothetical protein [Curtobacterium flaccumfaciens pv. flaccumfaciens]MBT1680491.1 hypothetical protein [Curtobacterium flaccumfaciens pv. flaccumfaciens]
MINVFILLTATTAIASSAMVGMTPTSANAATVHTYSAETQRNQPNGSNATGSAPQDTTTVTPGSATTSDPTGIEDSKRWVGVNSHGPWINLSITAQKVILAMTSAAVTSAVCRLPEVGWALCALSAVAFTGLFELLKNQHICPDDKPVFKWYLSDHPSYCH